MRGETGIGIDDDQVALRDTVRRWVTDRRPVRDARAALDADAAVLPPWWAEVAALGWLGLHVPESDGGAGAGLVELAVVLEELGRACAPGPFLPTVVASAAVDRFGEAPALRKALAGLADGTERAGVALSLPSAAVTHDDGTVDATWDVVLGGAAATCLLLPLEETPRGERWCVVPVEDVEVEALPGVDRTRRPSRVRAEGLAVGSDQEIRCPRGAAGVRGIAGLLAAAEAVGVAAWCVDTAAEHARTREQFGSPIGRFQAVKHRCADMLCSLEAARAACWEAAGALDRGAEGADLSVAVAAALGPEAAYRAAKDCIQVLGGIGFTWEHDAHLFLKRAMATRLLVGQPHAWRAEVAALVQAGRRAEVRVELPAEAEEHRRDVRGFVDDLLQQPKPEWNRRLADAGYLAPHWPAPWGRGAGPLEQLVIDEELRRARIRRPHLAVGAWALPTIIVHGTEAQRERFIRPTLRGELTWCQMFSEPGAGSDLASLGTRAVRTDGGWLLTGQKVWTSLAHVADWGICLARTDPDVPKHEGIGCFLVDMRSPGIDIRPLRELTGAEMFNEVFLTDVFVPDDCVVGGPTGGWEAARTTLGNERVSMGSGSSMGPGVEALLGLADQAGAFDDPLLADTLGELVCTAHAVAALGTRMTLRALAGAAPGAEASVRKLLGVEHDQRVQEVGLDLLGPAAASGEGAGSLWVGGFLGNRSLSIAGGTSEIQRNVIAERLLGLPRD
ncbi:MAG TPA: acyl-CoA dehydrogenase [Acidimicrobiales bacterium]|nr:acyl-CoA dehydrogenase [Acidimicrobiales bacterium]